jgi:hypothetical protein
MRVLCGLRVWQQIFSWYDHHMKLLCATVLIVLLASFAVAESLPKPGDVGKSPVNTVIEAEASSGQATISSSPIRNHAFVVKDEVVLVQGDNRLVIPLKSITAVSYSAVNILSISVSPTPLTEAPIPPTLLKTKDHLVGIVWTDKSETRGVVVKVAIGEYWGFMNGLQSAGIKPVNSDVVSIIK